MNFSAISTKNNIKNPSELLESLNLLMIFLLMNSKDIDTLYSTIENKLGFKWDGDGWLKLD